nr:hypothetical protein [uncultured Oscillibacter sp.]
MASAAKTSTNYLKELSIQLRSQEFTVRPGESGDIDVEYEGATLCRINDRGNLGCFAEKIAGKEIVLGRIRETARSTREYMTLLEQAPPLAAEELSEGFQLLAEFNGTVLAGHMTQYGAQFVTWEWVHNKTALWQGHYYGARGDSGGYQAAKRDFSVRSGLIPSSALFAPEQLTEIYRCIHETLENTAPIPDDRRKLLESAAGQIENFVPDLDERVSLSCQKEQELARELDAADSPAEGWMELS